MAKDWDRRTFMYTAALSILGGKQVADVCEGAYKDHLRNKIYHELPNHVHPIIARGIQENGKEKEKKGYGIRVGPYFLTCEHIVGLDKEVMSDFEGRFMSIDVPLRTKKVTVYGTELTEGLTDKKTDMAIYDLPKNLLKQIPKFPCRINTNLNLGKKVFHIGSPGGEGIIVRPAIIIDEDGFSPKLNPFFPTMESFGTNLSLIRGDSGTPVVDEEGKLVGISSMNIQELGYVIKMGEYLKYMEEEPPFSIKVLQTFMRGF
ncbi:MAG: serine protease [Nanoarchaeota archaeon]|nr:serine protease [Nanoarchaeota archaeon]